MDNYLSFAVDLALNAGRLIKRLSRERHTITYKGTVDLVTEADLQSEALIVDGIRKRYPDHSILAEEEGAIEPGSDYLWIIDPIDGTTNYAHGFPVYAVSIALEFKGDLMVGVIYDPNLDELFTAQQGKGAYLNGKPLHVSDIDDLNKTLLATGFPYSFRNDPETILDCFRKFSLRAQGIRRAGAATIDLVGVASGRFDGYWEYGLKPWDMAAGGLIALEAGARITQLNGEPFDIRSPQILATNGRIHDQMLEIIAECSK
ncbi:MAG TPA: inositol monophosphatase family protein [Candidatus Aquicultor sp.]|jgi:myo-inositol-1(or 4)-monophosphatase